MLDWVWTDKILTDAAQLLRTWHEASIDFDKTDAIWQSPDMSQSR